MIIKANKKYIDMSCIKHLIAEGEKNADKLTFEIERIYHNIDLSECTFILRGVNESSNMVEQTLSKSIDKDKIYLTWIIDEYFTAISGELNLEIRGVKGDELVIKYDLSTMHVRKSVIGEGLPAPNMIEKAISDMQEILATTKEISVKSPVIQNDTWWIFNSDTLVYEDTKISVKGEQGVKGDTGAKGEKGDKGEQGIQGLKGDAGEQGIQGLPGEKGDTGEKGLKGDTGDKGENGAPGAKGDKGERGLPGINGAKGEQGIQGDKGETGEQGIQGIQGIQGEQGLKGDVGEQGVKGDKGDTGDTGEQGIPGTDGQDGFSPIISVYENSTNVYRLQITDSEGSFITPNLNGNGESSVTYEMIFNNDSTAAEDYGSTIYIDNEGKSGSPTLPLTSLSTLITTKSDLLSSDNDYKLCFMPSDFGWGSLQHVISIIPITITTGEATLSVTYSSNDSLSQAIKLVQATGTGETLANNILTNSTVDGNYIDLSSFMPDTDRDNYITVCAFHSYSIPSGTYYLYMETITNNVAPYYKQIRIKL